VIGFAGLNPSYGLSPQFRAGVTPDGLDRSTFYFGQGSVILGKEALQPFGQFFGVFALTLPNRHDFPAELPDSPRITVVPRNILFEFIGPE
jgi:hypothetical protein